MAYFKLSLLTQTLGDTNNRPKFLMNTMSEFTDESALGRPVFSYTYNESLSLHKNAQKDLTFTMDKMVLQDNHWVTNPFAALVRVGAQVGLEDQYHNFYLFTVTNVKYNFKPDNVSYNITCQDSFTYQLTRQNNGYKIENDKDSSDFIGAKTIDWWVHNKIHPECHISYDYLPMAMGLYETIDGQVKTFQPNETLSNVARIIKHSYPKQDFPEYYTTLTFEGSGSAASVLINLGEQLDMMVCSYEHFGLAINKLTKKSEQSDTLVYYYWFEPLKHEEDSGISYSPRQELQAFQLSNSGKTLTSIMNVSGPTYDDENITLLPSISPFFSTLFQSTEWNDTKYNQNFFTERAKHFVYYSDFNGDFNITAIWNKTKTAFTQSVDGFIMTLAQQKVNTYIPLNYDNVNFVNGTDVSAVEFGEQNENHSVTQGRNKPTYRLSADTTAFQLGFGVTPGEYYARTKVPYYTSELMVLPVHQISADQFQLNEDKLQILIDPNLIPENSLISCYNKDNSLINVFVNTDLRSGDYVIYQGLNSYIKAEHENLCPSKQNIFFVGPATPATDAAKTANQYYWVKVFAETDGTWTFPSSVHIGTESTSIKQSCFWYPITAKNLQSLGGQEVKDLQVKVITDVNISTQQLINIHLVLNFTRTPTIEDLEFAAAADAIPWLENKLMDFHYFYQNGIINKAEYYKLMDTLYNQLRIVNGRLVYYTKDYYNALHQQTAVLATLQNSVDTLSAAFNYDIVSYYRQYGRIDDVQNTQDQYTNWLYSYLNPEQNTVALLNYPELITQYMTKYIQSQQRFLKNIYNFTNYFNSKPLGGEHRGVYEDTITLATNYWEPTEKNNYTATWLSFNEGNNFSPMTANQYNATTGKFTVPTYVAEGDHWLPLTYVHKDNYKSFYLATDVAERENWLYHSADNGRWDANAIYSKQAVLVMIDKLDQDDAPVLIELTNGATWHGVWSEEQNGYIYSRDIEGLNNQKTGRVQKFNELFDNNSQIQGNPDIKWIYQTVTFNEIKENYFKQHMSGSTKFTNIQHWITTSEMDPRVLKLYNFPSDKTQANKSFGLDCFSDYYDASMDVDTLLRNYGLQTFYDAHLPVQYGYYKDLRWVKYDNKWTLKDANNVTLEAAIREIIDNKQDIKQNEEPLARFFDKETNSTWHKIPVVTPDNYQNYWYYNKEKNVVSAGDNSYCTHDVTKASISPFAGWSRTLNLQNVHEKLTCIPMYMATKTSREDWEQDDSNFQQTGEGVIERTSTVDLSFKFPLYFYKSVELSITKDTTVHQGIESYLYPYKELEDGTVQYYRLDLTRCDSFVQNYPSWYSRFYYTPYQLQSYSNGSSEAYTPAIKLFGQWEVIKPGAKIQIDPTVNYKFLIIGSAATKPVPTDFSNNLAVQILNNQTNLKWVQSEYWRYMLRDRINEALSKYPQAEPFDPIAYYPLGLHTINLQKTDDTNSLEQLLSNNGISEAGVLKTNNDNDVYVNLWHFRYNYNYYEAVLIAERSTKTITLKEYNNTLSSDEKRIEKLAAKKWYDGYHQVNWLKLDDFTCGYYTAQSDNEFNQLAPADVFDDNYRYYTSVGTRVYTGRQYLEGSANQSAYCVDQKEYKTTSLFTNRTQWDCNTTLTQAHYRVRKPYVTWVFNDDPKLSSNIIVISNEGSWRIVSTTPQKSGDYYVSGYCLEDPVIEPTTEFNYRGTIYTARQVILEKQEELIFLDSSTQTLPIIFQVDDASNKVKGVDNTDYDVLAAQGLTLQYHVQGTLIQDLDNMTAGDFWYQYHSATQYTPLFEQAALIETQLEEYWQLAYSASLSCEYFIPEHWQLTVDGNTNYFQPMLYHVDNNHLSLCMDFIPQVQILNVGGQIKLPRYALTYQTDPKLQTTIADTFVDDVVYMTATSAYQDNPAILDIFQHINEDTSWLNQWTAELVGTTTYYQATGGVKWSELPSYLNRTNLDLKEYDGQYPMILKALLHGYSNRSIDEYEKVRDEHNQLWNQIYRAYGTIMLENNYSNTTATTSAELLTAAKNAFKDLSAPEHAYSISLIDANALNGYKGQELHIGDCIRVDPQAFNLSAIELRDEFNQPLFVSDIKYTLRKRDGISLTVNTIKYQDKLMQRLVKLMK